MRFQHSFRLKLLNVYNCKTVFTFGTRANSIILFTLLSYICAGMPRQIETSQCLRTVATNYAPYEQVS